MKVIKYSFLFYVFFSCSLLLAATETWNIDANGNWNNGVNWVSGSFPNAASDTAIFPNILTGARNITLGQDITIGSISFQETNNGYTILGGGNTLTFDNGGADSIITTTYQPSIQSNIILNNDVIVNHTGSSFAIEGDISGAFGLQLNGTSTRVVYLVGNNTYSGGTVSSVFLRAGATALQGDIANNGRMQIIAGGNLAANLSGAGEIWVENVPAVTPLIMTGNNTYTGRLFAHDSYISIDSANRLGDSSSGYLDMDNSTLITTADINAAHRLVMQGGAGGFIDTDGHTVTLSGNITGGGPLTKIGTGTLILSGNNTYLGTTTVTTGTLQGSASSLPGDIINNATLLFSQTATGTYAGDISGTGNFEKTGTGNLSLTGNISQSTVTFSEGKVFVQGNVESNPNDLTIAANSTLWGTGTITGNVTVRGGIHPGNSIGTTHVDGDVTFATGSIFSVEMNPTASDLLDVTGSVTIENGTTIEIIPDMGSGSYAQPHVATVISTGTGVTGQFSNITTPYPAFVGEVDYDNPLLVRIWLNVAPLSSVINGGNAGVVAEYIDSLPVTPGSDLANVKEQLEFLSADAMREALNQLQPALYKTLLLTQENNSIRVAAKISDRIESLFTTTCARNAEKKRGINLWFNPFGDWSHQSGYDDLRGFKSATGAFLLGSDFEVFTNTYVGLCSGYSYSDVKWNHSAGKGDVNSYYGGLYTTWYNDIFFIDFAIIGAYNQYKARREINFSATQRTAKSKHDGGEVTTHVDVGCLCDVKGLEIRPFASADYIYLHEDNFTEKGADSLNLKVRKKDYTMWRTELGLNIAKCFPYPSGKWIPDVGIHWVREMRQKGKNYTSQFVDQEEYFIISGMKPNRNMIAPSFALSYIFNNDGNIISIQYDGEFGRHYDNHNMSLQAICRF